MQEDLLWSELQLPKMQNPSSQRDTETSVYAAASSVSYTTLATPTSRPSSKWSSSPSICTGYPSPTVSFALSLQPFTPTTPTSKCPRSTSSSLVVTRKSPKDDSKLISLKSPPPQPRKTTSQPPYMPRRKPQPPPSRKTSELKWRVFGYRIPISERRSRQTNRNL